MPPQLSVPGAATPLANQVAGHQNVMSDESGSLVIKPALPKEIAFYHLLGSTRGANPLAKFKRFVPQFYGTLRLEGQLNASGGVSKDGLKVDDVPESIVLENQAQNFTRPCVMDVKLGIELHEEDATDEKRERMMKQARQTTSHETGVRLTGCQVWHQPTSSFILTPKSFGKTIKASDLPSGMKRFFPLPTDVLPNLAPATASAPSTPTSATSSAGPASGAVSHVTMQDTSLAASGETTASSTSHLAPPTPVSPNTSSSPTEYAEHAIPPATMLRLLTLIDEQLSELEKIVSTLEARFIGSSILMVYEGDPERLEEALDRYDAKMKALKERESAMGASTIPEKRGVDEADLEEGDSLEDEEEDEDGSDLDSSTSSDDDSQDGTRADARRARRCPPMTVKMIDFAHTRLVGGEGPDQGVLKGFKTLRGLIQGRKEEVEKATTA